MEVGRDVGKEGWKGSWEVGRKVEMDGWKGSWEVGSKVGSVVGRL